MSRSGGQAAAGPHERQCRGGGEALGRPVLHGPIEIHGADAEVAAAGGQQLPGELVVWLVRGDRLPHPAMVRLGGVGPRFTGNSALIRSTSPQRIAW